MPRGGPKVVRDWPDLVDHDVRLPAQALLNCLVAGPYIIPMCILFCRILFSVVFELEPWTMRARKLYGLGIYYGPALRLIVDHRGPCFYLNHWCDADAYASNAMAYSKSAPVNLCCHGYARARLT
jgi:hypothetical protein